MTPATDLLPEGSEKRECGDVISSGVRDPSFAIALEARIKARGIHAALELLNSRTRYRFTGLYHVDAEMLRNVALFDRENPTLCSGGDISLLRDTYCSIVVARDAAFSVENSEAYAGDASHPASTSVASYLGVPVRSRDGVLFGTLCHFDNRPRIAPRGEVEALETAAAVFSSTLEHL